MSVAGLCELCERPDADYGCDRCGRVVCERHFDETVGVCVECAPEVRGPHDQVDPGDLPDGVDTYRF